MMGTEDNPGVNRRAIKELFEVCSKNEESEYAMNISLMEVYNENVYDLLASGDDVKVQDDNCINTTIYTSRVMHFPSCTSHAAAVHCSASAEMSENAAIRAGPSVQYYG